MLQTILIIVAGVAIGAGWQAYVAYVNIICYYVLGIPLGIVLGFIFNASVKVSSIKITLIILP